MPPVRSSRPATGTGSAPSFRRPRRPGRAGRACRDEPGPGAESTMSCSFPIRAHFDEKQVLGTLVAAWDLGQAFGRLGREQPLVAGRAHFVLLRRDGLVVAASPGIESGAPRGSRLFSGTGAEWLVGEGRRGFRVTTIAGEPHLVGYARSAGLSGWSLVVTETTTVAFAPAYRLRNAVLAVAAGVGLVAFLLSILGSARLTRPLRELDAAARRVAEGDLDRASRATVRGRDRLALAQLRPDDRESRPPAGPARRQGVRRLPDRRNGRRPLRRRRGGAHRAGKPGSRSRGRAAGRVAPGAAGRGALHGGRGEYSALVSSSPPGGRGRSPRSSSAFVRAAAASSR